MKLTDASGHYLWLVRCQDCFMVYAVDGVNVKEQLGKVLTLDGQPCHCPTCYGPLERVLIAS